MADWRIGRTWSEQEIRRQLERHRSTATNFEDDPDELILRPDWYSYSSESVIANTDPGPPVPDGPFERGRIAVDAFAFSDTRIVRAYFDADAPLLHRRMLLELKAFRMVRYLAGVVVGAVREETTEDATVYGFRYDTLEGHIERGAEWFLLTKKHETGALRFRIAARWLPGDFPNWWSRLGFQMLGRHYQKKWHHRAHKIMADLVRDAASSGSFLRTQNASKPDIIFERSKSHA